LEEQLSVWEALAELDRARPRVGEQVTAALRGAIVAGRLTPGTRLPSTRDLAVDLGLSRGLVVAAYEQLVAEGRLVSQRGSGTVVSLSTTPSTVEPDVADGRHQTVAPLRPGVPDLGMFPRTAWRRSYERALSTAMDADLDYGDPAGAPKLRHELAAYLGRVRAALVEPACIALTTGAAQAFTLLAKVLVAAGRTRIGFEDPGPTSIRHLLASHGLRPVPVPVDADGIDVDALTRARIGAVYVTPAHQFPTGVVLAPARRTALVDWARQTGALIVEDDYDAEFRYDRDPVGCLQGLAPDVVALVGSVSRALAPGIRLGWLVAPRQISDRLATAKLMADHGGPVLEQLALADLLAGGGYDRHVRRVRRVHRQRRDAMVAALGRYLTTGSVSGVAAGLHLVVELPPGMDDAAIAARAHDAGLGPMALSQLRVQARGRPGLVLGYAAHSAHELGRAVRLLGRLVRADPSHPVVARLPAG
jgi:GntR family transcriptional regulator/MocR family aminotransferase